MSKTLQSTGSHMPEAVLADDPARAVDLLEPSLGSYGIRADSA